MNTKSKKMENSLIIEGKSRKIADNVYARPVRMTEEYVKNLPYMPQSVIDRTISAEDFKAKHPYPYDKI